MRASERKPRYSRQNAGVGSEWIFIGTNEKGDYYFFVADQSVEREEHGLLVQTGPKIADYKIFYWDGSMDNPRFTDPDSWEMWVIMEGYKWREN